MKTVYILIKITSYAKNQEDLKMKKTTDANNSMTETLELSDDHV